MYAIVYQGIRRIPGYKTCIPGYTRVHNVYTRIYKITNARSLNIPGSTSGVGVLTMHWCLPYICEHWYVLCIMYYVYDMCMPSEQGSLQCPVTSRHCVVTVGHCYLIVTPGWDILSQHAAPALCLLLTQLTSTSNWLSAVLSPPTSGHWHLHLRLACKLSDNRLVTCEVTAIN